MGLRKKQTVPCVSKKLPLPLPPPFTKISAITGGEGLETNRSPKPKILVRKDSLSRKIRHNETKVGHKKGEGGGKWAYSVAADLGLKRANKEERGLCREGCSIVETPHSRETSIWRKTAAVYETGEVFRFFKFRGTVAKTKNCTRWRKKNTFSFEFSIFSYLAQQCDSPLPSVLT